VKYFYSKNYKSLKTKIEEDIRKWKDLPGSWISRINIVKIGILPKVIYMFNCNLHQNSNDIPHRGLKMNPKFHIEAQQTSNSQGNSKQKEKGCLQVITIPNFKLYYRATAIKIAWYWHKNRWNRIPRHKSTQLQSSDF
jgi:hypothetical protein